jgi:hypothetical protein
MLRHFTTVQALLRQEPVLDSSRTVSGPLLRQRDPHDTSKVRHLLAGGDCRSLGNGILWHFGAGVSTRASARMECPRASKKSFGTSTTESGLRWFLFGGRPLPVRVLSGTRRTASLIERSVAPGLTARDRNRAARAALGRSR